MPFPSQNDRGQHQHIPPPLEAPRRRQFRSADRQKRCNCPVNYGQPLVECWLHKRRSRFLPRKKSRRTSLQKKNSFISSDLRLQKIKKKSKSNFPWRVRNSEMNPRRGPCKSPSKCVMLTASTHWPASARRSDVRIIEPPAVESTSRFKCPHGGQHYSIRIQDAERVVRQSAGQSERTEGSEIRVAGLTVQYEDAECVSTVVFNPVVQQRQTDEGKARQMPRKRSA